MNNHLTTLPAEMCQLTHLHSLYLGGNPLTFFPAELEQLPALREDYQFYLDGLM